MERFFSKKTALISFFVLIGLQMICYNYIDYLRMEPRSIHSWRQADCLSFMLNFYNGRTTFWEPGVSNLGPTGDGKIASDFPLLQYSVAQLWKITGVSTPLYRMINLAFLVLGLLYVYKLYCYWFANRYWLALLATGLIYTSALLAYYGPTPLSDIQALGLSCTAFYYFILWLDDKNKKHFMLSIVLFLLAGLFKMSAAFIFAIAGAYWLIRSLKRGEDRKEWFSPFVLAGLALPFIPWLSWYLYVGHYNQIHPNDYFLIGILPIWIVKVQHISEVLTGLKNNIIPIVFNPFFLLLLLFILISGFLIRAKSFFSEEYLRLLIPVLVVFSYLLLFFKVFEEHDYYLINMMPVLVILLGLLTKFVLERRPDWMESKAAKIGPVLLLVFLTHETAVLTRARIEMKGWGFDSLVFSKEKREYFEWNTWYDRSRYEVLETIEEDRLNMIGLTGEQKVLCLGDLTINRSLYLLNRLGYTSFRRDLAIVDQFIEEHKKEGLGYLIIIDWEGLPKEKLEPYLKNKVYEKNGTFIYKL